ncbi:hypothetical protein Tco_0000233 [Tanacetum coccineum]
MESSMTCEYLSLIQTFFYIHTYGGEFAQDEAQVLAGQDRDGISIDEPRSKYTDAEIDEIKEEAKREGRRSESGGGGDDELCGDDDANRDGDTNGDEEI